MPAEVVSAGAAGAGGPSPRFLTLWDGTGPRKVVGLSNPVVGLVKGERASPSLTPGVADALE